ncbi:hypothetical protein OsI_17726 [Oryza sativa Indica Group]|uniref:Bulb-type lectin domain-containing protein n=1 Tax=Oryza sativa subsp. indica TaxID=39946 RepID=B8AVL8_ORYSI|nr:hypothetical protein OsI_17726 [Oryza sativa Indica Group]
MCLLVLATFLSCIALSAGDHRSVLWRGGSIAVEDAAENVLVSPSGNFSYGFYKVATNAYTLAVWFTASADATVAWTATRDSPVNGVGSRAELRRDGSLEKLKRDDDEEEVSTWLEELVDARLRGDFNHVQAAAMLELAVCCVDGEPNRRPSMNAVAQKLLSLHDTR